MQAVTVSLLRFLSIYNLQFMVPLDDSEVNKIATKTLTKEIIINFNLLKLEEYAR